jgi:hypothetical protein
MSEKGPGLSHEAHKRLEAERDLKELMAIIVGGAVTGFFLLRFLPIWAPAAVGFVVGDGMGWVLERRIDRLVAVGLTVAGLIAVGLLVTVGRDLPRLARVGHRWNPNAVALNGRVLGEHVGALIVWGLPWLLVSIGATILWRRIRGRGNEGNAHDLGDGELVIKWQ